MAMGITECGRPRHSLCRARPGFRRARRWKDAEPRLGGNDQLLEEGGSSVSLGRRRRCSPGRGNSYLMPPQVM